MKQFNHKRIIAVLVGACSVIVSSGELALAQTPARRSTTPAAKQPEPAKSGTRAPAPRPAAQAAAPAVIPVVMFSKLETSLNTVKVGDAFPAMQLKQLSGPDRELAKLYGTKATVIAFWKSDRRMTRSLLADLGPDVGEKFAKEGINVVGISVDEKPEIAAATVLKAGAKFPTLHDPDGKALAQIGKDKLPRVYLVDAQGKVLWFDIEYSLTTRRELGQAVRAIVEKK